jgi:phosphoglucosamine mutase
MTPEICMGIGRAAALYFGCRHVTQGSLRIVVGKDTRRSGDMVECAVAAGILSQGADAILVGVLPTPGIALVTRQLRANAGVVVSASHNPARDNGIKLFDMEGFKLSSAAEDEIERVVKEGPALCGGEPGRAYTKEDAGRTYRQFLENTLPHGVHLDGIRVVLDCANGAAHRVAPQVFMQLGATVDPIHIMPDGENINDNCGSQHPEKLRERVLATGADLGIAFDGDGDRMVAVDAAGTILSGDQILAACAWWMKEQGRLAGNTVVSTVMSNLGLKKALMSMGARHIETAVGDRRVLEGIQKSGAVLGGEDSGHFIFLEYHSTGDGVLSAIQLMRTMAETGKPLAELARIMEVYPQTLVNVDVMAKPELSSVPEIAAAVREAEAALAGAGRALVRYSGTQSKCRVMVEGPDKRVVEKLAQGIAEVVRAKLG